LSFIILGFIPFSLTLFYIHLCFCVVCHFHYQFCLYHLRLGFFTFFSFFFSFLVRSLF